MSTYALDDQRPSSRPRHHACIGRGVPPVLSEHISQPACADQERDAMTMTAQVNPELAETPCSVAKCLETASTMGAATVSVGPHTDTPPDFATITFGLPLCINHAHLLRRGCQLLDFHSGI
jgi:hypothetical protein